MGCEFWFATFVVEHQTRFASRPWFKADSPLAELWREAFDRDEVAEAEATAASRELAYLSAIGKLPAPKREAHLGAILERVRRRRARSTAAGAAPASREQAEEQSRGCDECGGGGLTRRRFDLRGRKDPVWLSCYCHRCAMGRWMKAAHSGDPALRGRIVDLLDHEALWDQPDSRAGERRAWDPAQRAFVGRAIDGDDAPGPAADPAAADASRRRFEEWRRARGAGDERS